MFVRFRSGDAHFVDALAVHVHSEADAHVRDGIVESRGSKDVHFVHGGVTISRSLEDTIKRENNE